MLKAATKEPTRRSSTRSNSAKSILRPKKSKNSQSSKTTTRWSARVMRQSDAMDLKKGVFTQSSGLAVARSLKASAEKSNRRKSPPFRSAMSMLNFEINRGGKNLTDSRRRILNQAKVQLRKLFGRAA